MIQDTENEIWQLRNLQGAGDAGLFTRRICRSYVKECLSRHSDRTSPARRHTVFPQKTIVTMAHLSCKHNSAKGHGVGVRDDLMIVG